MKTKKTLNFLSQCLKDLNLERGTTDVLGNSPLTNIQSTKQALYRLKKNDFLSKQISQVWGVFFATAPNDSEEINVSMADTIIKSIKNIKSTLFAIIEVLEKLSPASSEESVYIKIPSSENFEELTSILGELKKAISLPISHSEINGSITIKSVDNGSIWFEIALGSPIAVGVIGSIAWAAAVIRKKRLEGDILRKQIESMDLSIDQKKIFLEAQKKQVSSLLDTEALEIAKKNHSEIVPEEIERLKVSINTTAKLIDKGFEIHPSVLVPETVSNLFPDFKKLNLIESRTKQINQNSSEDAA